MESLFGEFPPLNYSRFRYTKFYRTEETYVEVIPCARGWFVDNRGMMKREASRKKRDGRRRSTWMSFASPIIFCNSSLQLEIIEDSDICTPG